MNSKRLVHIKKYYVDDIPDKETLEEAKQICINENCVIDLKWCPHVRAGWYHVYIDKDSNVDEIFEQQVPKVYPI